MSETSEPYEQATLWDIDTSIYSQVSEVSLSASSGQVSQITSPFLQVDSPARISAMQGNEQELTENDQDYGLRCTVSFAAYDHNTSVWKTSQLCLDGELSEFSETWPRAGTMLNGKCYQQHSLELPISEIESSLLPTPTASDNGGYNQSRGSNARIRPGLKMMARENLWPTPRASDGAHGGPNQKDSHGKPALAALAYKYPTPAARDYRGAGSKEGYERRRNNGHQQSLNEEIVHGPNGQPGGQLNPIFVEWLMGYPLGWTDLKDSETP